MIWLLHFARGSLIENEALSKEALQFSSHLFKLNGLG